MGRVEAVSDVSDPIVAVSAFAKRCIQGVDTHNDAFMVALAFGSDSFSQLSAREKAAFLEIFNLGIAAMVERRTTLAFDRQFEQQLVTSLITDFNLAVSAPEELHTINELYQDLGVDSIQGFYDYVHQRTPLHAWLPKKRDSSKGYILQSPIKGYSREFAIKRSLMQLVALSLIRQLEPEELKQIEYVVGFAESGIGLAMCVSLLSGIPMIATRTTPDDVPEKGRIALYEPGASFAGLYTSIPEGSRVWLVDDEMTRGWTAVSFYNSFVERGIKVVANSVVFEVLGRGMDGKNYFEQETGRELNTLIKINLPEN